MARRRPHPAAATRILLFGLTTASTLAIVSGLAFGEKAATVTSPSVAATPTPPPTIVRQVYRYVPASGSAPSVGATPAPTPPGAPTPVTQTRGS